MKTGNLLLFIFLVFVLACTKTETNQQDLVIAEVVGKNLKYTEIKNIFPSDQLNANDSAELINEYISKWIKQQLLVAEAEKNLSAEDLDIEYELEKYRQELLIHKFKTKQINKLINNEIHDTVILNYYNSHLKLFILDHTIIRVKYIIFPNDIEVKPSFKRKLSSKKEIDITDYEDFIFKYAKKYDNFDKNWIYFEDFIESINYDVSNSDQFLSKNKIIEFTKDNELHLILIEDYILHGKLAPHDFVSPQIRSLIINDKKLDFLREIKDSLYDNALKYNKFRVFN